MEKLHLPSSMKPFVKEIIFFESFDKKAAHKIPFYADGFAGIDFSQSDHPFSIQPQNKVLPDFYLYGQTLIPMRLETKGAFQVYAIRLFPFAVRTLIEQVMDDLLNDSENADIPEKLVPILKYVKKLTLTPSRMVMQDAQDVFDAGWSEKALQDVICICCLFNFFNRLVDGHGIKGNENLYQLGADHLTKNGYGVPWFIRFIKGFIRKSKVKTLQSLEQNKAA